jgi:heme oxygenase
MKTDITACLPHAVLREQTRVEHERVEATAAMRHLFDDTMNVSSYVQLLRGYVDLYASWESRHAHWLRELASAGWIYESRLPALEYDLDSLEGVSETPVHQHAPEDAKPAWGALYVIEGSLLGGQVIARQLAKRLPAHQHRFFNLGSHRPSHAWKDFQSLLDAALAEPEQLRAALLQARETFALFQVMFEALPATERDACVTQE